MTVRVNKSSFNIREKLSELGRKFGLKGSELMAAETVKEAREIVSAGRKNLVINGAMEIAQRSTSGTKSGSSYGGYLCVDRWASYYDQTAMEQTSVTIDGKLKKALKVTAGGSNGRPYVYHKIENSSKFLGDGTPFSISFWMRASAPTIQQLQWRYYDNGNENNGSNQFIKNLNVTTDWQYYKIENLSIPDASHNRTRDGGLWNYNNLGEVGSGLWIEFTDVQIELGKQCTEFEQRSVGEELILCQRYFIRQDWVLCNNLSNIAYRWVPPGPSVNMRATPAMAYYHPTTGTANQTYEHSSGTTRTINSSPAALSATSGTTTYFGTSTNGTYAQYVRVFMNAEL